MSLLVPIPTIYVSALTDATPKCTSDANNSEAVSAEVGLAGVGKFVLSQNNKLTPSDRASLLIKVGSGAGLA